jgi:hypothetical protein
VAAWIKKLAPADMGAGFFFRTVASRIRDDNEAQGGPDDGTVSRMSGEQILHAARARRSSVALMGRPSHLE